MTEANSINAQTTGIVGNTGTAFTGTAVTNHAVIIGGSTSSTLSNIGPTSTAGQVLQSAGASADPSFSTPTYPSASGSAGKILRADGTNNVYSTATYPDTAGTSGNVLTSDGTNWISSTLSPVLTPTSVIQLVDDFCGTFSLAAQAILYSQLNWLVNTTNVWVPSNSTDSSHPGILNYVTGGAGSFNIFAGNRASTTKVLSFILGGGTLTVNWVFNLANLSDGTNRYILRCGMGDTTTSATDQANGVYFEYSDNINSGQWVYKTALATSRTTSNSTTTVTSGWHKATLTVNAAASSVSFSIDGVSLGTDISTNIPTAAITPFFWTQQTLGTVATGSVQIDLFSLTQTLTTPR